MTDDLLKLGLTGLVNTHRTFQDQWFHGHHGAGVLAAHFIRTTFDLAPEVDEAIATYARQIIDTFPDLFRCHQTKAPAEEFSAIPEALSQHIKTLTADGHDIIFASMALKALHARPDLATPDTIQGLLALLEDAQTDNPKRYYGYDDYVNDPVDYSEIPVFESITQAAEYTLDDHKVIYPDQALNGQHYFFAGNRLHDITHVHALLELEALGYRDLANTGMDALRKQFHLCSTEKLPAHLEPFETDELLDPRTLAFWQRGKRDAHQVKLAYAVMCLIHDKPEEYRLTVLKDISKYWLLLA